MARVIEYLAGDWRRFDQARSKLLRNEDAGCARLMSIPGSGPIISSAMVAAIGCPPRLSCVFHRRGGYFAYQHMVRFLVRIGC